MSSLPKKELKSHQDLTRCYICRKRFSKQFAKYKNYWNVRDHCHFTGKYRGLTHSICNLRFNVPNEISVVFYNRSNYDYHFIIQELINEFKSQFEIQTSTKLFTVSIDFYNNFLQNKIYW